MPRHYDRNRDAKGRWDESEDRGRGDRGKRYGRGNEQPRQEERGSYYGQRGYDEDRYRGPEYESRHGGAGHAAAARRGRRHRQH